MRSLVEKHYVRLMWYCSPALAEGNCQISFAFIGSSTQTLSLEEVQAWIAGAPTLGSPVLLLPTANHNPGSGCLSQDLQHNTLEPILSGKDLTVPLPCPRLYFLLCPWKFHYLACMLSVLRVQNGWDAKVLWPHHFLPHNGARRI